MAEDERFMRRALELAQQAVAHDEVPVGALVVREGQVIAEAFNAVEAREDASAHAEMLALKMASHVLGCKWLHGCTLYVTLEPCAMCAGNVVLARLKRVCYGAADPKTGAAGSVLDVLAPGLLNHTVDLQADCLATECGALLTNYFRGKRNLKTAHIKCHKTRD